MDFVSISVNLYWLTVIWGLPTVVKFGGRGKKPENIIYIFVKSLILFVSISVNSYWLTVVLGFADSGEIWGKGQKPKMYIKVLV